MTAIPLLRSLIGARIVDARELDRAPRALIDFGQAPDGLPWLCDVDRSGRINQIYSTVAQMFEVDSIEELPPSVREATEGALARGLMGVHAIDLDGRGEQNGFVTRRTARSLFGQTLLEQILAPNPMAFSGPPPAPSSPQEHERAAVTSMSVVGFHDALEQALEASRAGRHVVFTLTGQTWTAIVSDANRALRVPSGPYRRAVFESLAALSGAQARVTCGYESWTAPMNNLGAYVDAVVRAGESTTGGTVTYEVPRATVLRMLVAVAQLVGDKHRRGIVHADLTPSNIMLDGGKPVSPDALDIEVGQLSAAATFEWAAPEQIVGRPLDPRADVFSLGKMVCTLVGAVPFGEKIDYVVPTGGNVSKTVQLLKTDGVFIDAKLLGVDRAWQAAWQDAVGKLVAYDREKRLDSGVAAAQVLGELAERFPPPGVIQFRGNFGAIMPMQTPALSPLARVLVDR